MWTHAALAVAPKALARKASLAVQQSNFYEAIADISVRRALICRELRRA